MSTKVVFRKFKDGEVIALFPQIPGDNTGNLCQAYGHGRFHEFGAADPDIVMNKSKPATKAEYAPLITEIHSRGYRRLIIGKKFTNADSQIRKKAAKPSCGCRSR